ncbi:MAG: hypothetical protein ACODAD_11355, partial [Planctomycetota bacterium]
MGAGEPVAAERRVLDTGSVGGGAVGAWRGLASARRLCWLRAGRGCDAALARWREVRIAGPRLVGRPVGLWLQLGLGNQRPRPGDRLVLGS